MVPTTTLTATAINDRLLVVRAKLEFFEGWARHISYRADESFTFTLTPNAAYGLAEAFNDCRDALSFEVNDDASALTVSKEEGHESPQMV